jgi:hypothetical protein
VHGLLRVAAARASITPQPAAIQTTKTENKKASPVIVEGVTMATTPTGTKRPIQTDRRGNFDRSERRDRTGSKGAKEFPR